MLKPLEVFGPSISTAEGADWQRQRKLTATPFNEQKSSLVWAETLRQANDMLCSWSSHGRKGSTHASEDVRTLALNVLAFAGFQRSYPWRSQQALSEQTTSSYRDALAIILKNVLVILVLPAKVFSFSFLPKKWTQIGWAISAFKQYMLDQVADEKRLISEDKPGSGNLVSNLVRASYQQGDTDHSLKVTGETKSEGPRPLSIEEILGNIFVFNFAGHDTTAISLAYGVFLLTAHPKVQDWISEEINFYLTSSKGNSVRYEDTFLKLQRCLAVLLETLRLYNPIPGVDKYTGPCSQALKIKDRNLHIPPNTLVVPHLQALHTHPRYWGSDSLTWRPSRWILSSLPETSSNTTTNLEDTLSAERLMKPQKGTFIPWSEGLQNCPGKKFAQVEFVATMATLFRHHRAEPVPKYGGESIDEARKRVLETVKNSGLELLLQMRDPGSVRIRWTSN
ncbi:MAG: hypothetical protein Q9181_002372 [Wetmoreana brouardii]